MLDKTTSLTYFLFLDDCRDQLLLSNENSSHVVAAPAPTLDHNDRPQRSQIENYQRIITDLEKKTVIKAPHIPAIKNPTDTSNFEEFEDDGGAEWARFNDKSTNLFEDFC